MPKQPKLCAFDIETRGAVPEFVSGAIVSDECTEWFTDASKMIERLRDHARKRYTLVAHNAEYDTTNLLWAFGEDVRIEYISNAWASAYWRWASNRPVCPIWDSMRLSAGLSLAKVGEAIGIPKLEMPKRLADPDDIRQDWYCDIHSIAGCIQCYNVRDTEIVWGYCNMMREWCDGYGAVMRRSIPRLAVELWSIFDPGQQQQLRSPVLKEFGREGYHGARCELFIHGAAGTTHCYDKRTFYGSILHTVRLPAMSSLHYQENPKEVDWDGQSDGIIDATVEVVPQHVPPLPAMRDGRIYYPVGTFRGTWPLSELRSAIPYGCNVVKVHRSATGPTLVSPFQTTAGVMIELRDTFIRKGDPRSVLPKFILNAIVGRLGLHDTTSRVSYRRWRKGMGSADIQRASVESAGGSLFLAVESPIVRPSKYANVIWASIINGLGRSRLYPHLLEAGEDLLYCDTDSVHSLRPIATGPDSAGQLRHTGTYDKGLYLAPKFYRLERYDGTGEVRAKGIPRRYADEYIATGGAAFQTTLGIVESIQRGISPGTWVTVERSQHHAPGARTILDPSAIGQNHRSSPTAPVVFTLSGLGGNVMTND
jgi:hypothetical protein